MGHRAEARPHLHPPRQSSEGPRRRVLPFRRIRTGIAGKYGLNREVIRRSVTASHIPDTFPAQSRLYRPGAPPGRATNSQMRSLHPHGVP